MSVSLHLVVFPALLNSSLSLTYSLMPSNKPTLHFSSTATTLQQLKLFPLHSVQCRCTELRCFELALFELFVGLGQMWLTDLPDDHPGKKPATKPDAVQLASGECKYSNDVPPTMDTLYAAYVIATQAPAKVLGMFPRACCVLVCICRCVLTACSCLCFCL